MPRRRSAGGAPMRALAAVLAAWLLLGHGAVANGQEPVSESSRYVRVGWTLEPTRRDYSTLCGSVYHLPARHVELLIETRDAAGNAPRSRVLHSVNDVPPGGRRIFCLPEPAGTTVERVTVRAIEWGFHREAP